MPPVATRPPGCLAQMIWIDGEVQFELGNYLGGGAAGVVYEGVDMKVSELLAGRNKMSVRLTQYVLHSAVQTPRNVAIKILNPVGFKLMPHGTLQRCIVARKGLPLSEEAKSGREPMTAYNIWWLVHPNSKHMVAAYQEPQHGQLREMALPKCIETWGWDPVGASQEGRCSTPTRESFFEKSDDMVTIDGVSLTIPRVPHKYLKWLRNRQSIYREISNMVCNVLCVVSHVAAQRALASPSIPFVFALANCFSAAPPLDARALC